MILADPFAGIDPESASIIARLIAELTEGGTAVIIFSDDAAGLVHLCEMIYELERGRIVGSYSPREREKAAFPFKVPVRGADKVILVNPADILYAHSKDGRTCLHTGSEDFPLHPGGTGGEAAPERLLSRPPCLSGQPPAGQRDHSLHPRLFHPGLECPREDGNPPQQVLSQGVAGVDRVLTVPFNPSPAPFTLPSAPLVQNLLKMPPVSCILSQTHVGN